MLIKINVTMCELVRMTLTDPIKHEPLHHSANHQLRGQIYGFHDIATLHFTYSIVGKPYQQDFCICDRSAL